MSVSRIAKSKDKMSFIRLLAIGLVAAIVITLVMVCVASLILSLLERITQNAIIPITYVIITLGCFIGAYIISRISGERGVLVGAILGTVFFIFLLIVGCFSSGFRFGSNAFFKFIILLLSGCCGSYVGGHHRYSGKRRKY